MSLQAPGGAVPYHVQTTASALRDGFPWFAHHESVSALWGAEVARALLKRHLPVHRRDRRGFRSGVRRIGPLVWRRPGFPPPARRLCRAIPSRRRAPRIPCRGGAPGGSTGRGKEPLPARSRGYRIARFPINRSRLGQEAWHRGKAAYEAGGRLLDPPNLPVAIPFTAADTASGDLQGPIGAYLRVPAGTVPANGWPVLLFICGLDAYKNDNAPRIDEHLRRGMATVSFEIPGTGDCPAAPNDPTSPDRLMSSVLDWVRANAGHFGFDTGRILARGISTGGYYAFRVAHTHPPALFAVVAEGGGCHHMFDPAWIGAQNQMEYPFALADALAYRFGYRDADPAAAIRRYAAEARKSSLLDAGILDRPSCRLLAIDGMEGSIFPIEDNFIVAVRGTGKDLIARGNRGHMGNPGAEEIVYDWIDQALAAGPGGWS